MVERLNRSILQMLRSYVTKESDWEQYLPLIMHAYRTTVHSSTQVSPFQLMFGHHPQFNSFHNCDVSDATSYGRQLQEKLAKLQDMVEANLVQAAQYQKQGYDRSTHTRTFAVNDPVWLLIPRQGKLDSKWQGGWTVKEIKSPVNINIVNDNGHCKVVHINRFQHRVQPPVPSNTPTSSTDVTLTWNPPQTEHILIPCDPTSPANSEASARRYPLRSRHPPDRLQI